MKKRTVLICFLVSALLLGGCRIGTQSPADSHTGQSTDLEPVEYDKYLAQYEGYWQYRYLDREAQACYGAIYTVLTDNTADETVTVGEDTGPGVRVKLPYPLHSKEEVTTLYNAFFRDNPEFFYVGNAYGLEGYMEDDTPYYDTLVLTYTQSAAQRTQNTRQLNERILDLLDGSPPAGDDYAIELFLHDRLLAACTYDSAAAKDNGYEQHTMAFTAYGALVEGKAVCEGYARAMQLLLRRRGIDSTLVIGRSLENNQEHMWNLVTVNGQNYYLDPTWDDGDDRIQHGYFNLTTAQLERTHTIAEGQSGIDTCTAQTDNYFQRQGAYFDTYNRDEIAAVIAKEVAAGQEIVELRFAPNKYDNAMLFLKNYSLTQAKVQPHLPTGSETLWAYRLLANDGQYVLTMVKD